jgi:hypothetical protein
MNSTRICTLYSRALRRCIQTRRALWGRATRDDASAWMLALSLSMCAPLASAQIAFNDASVAAGIDRRGESYGASWGDLNGDGYPDIFTSNHRQRPSLFLNMGDGTFFDTGPQVLPWRNRQRADTHGATWSDFDNDGDQDLLVSTGVGNPSQFLVNEYGRLVDRTIERGVAASSVGGRLPVWLDYDGDGLTDFVMTQFGGIAKLFKQGPPGSFTETTGDAKLLCKRFHYGQLFDVTGDGRLDFVCPKQDVFPQKIYDTRPLPWAQVFDSANPTPVFPSVRQVVDSVIGDFDNDGYLDMFLLSNVQLRPSSVVQSGPNSFEAQLTGGIKGFNFVTPGSVTITFDWNKQDERTTISYRKVRIGASGKNPDGSSFTLDPSDPDVVGMPAPPTEHADLPVMLIGFDPAAQRWRLVLQTKLNSTSPGVFSEAYLQVTSTEAVSNLASTGLWPSDREGRPTLLMYRSGTWVDETVAAGLDAPVQCGSVTAGDFDNDMDLDLYLACRTGASNIANILYENLGNGTFRKVDDAGGASGPVGPAVASGAGTADSVITADYNLDGFLDLFVTNGVNLRPLNFGGPNSLFQNVGNANHWIQLDLVGTRSDRDAVGARVYATANGVTQVRVQNGSYRRWSQDLKRAHFGLAGSPTVDLRVEWPSGTVEAFSGIAANQLYRITEGEGIAPVALGAAPAYQCGPPKLDGAVQIGVFIWRDCPSGEWRLKTASGGGDITYAGKITSSANYLSVRPMGLWGPDLLDYTTNPQQISFSFRTKGTGTDGVNFIAQEGASTCLQIDAPQVQHVFYGPFLKPVAQPFDLETQASCARAP